MLGLCLASILFLGDWIQFSYLPTSSNWSTSNKLFIWTMSLCCCLTEATSPLSGPSYFKPHGWDWNFTLTPPAPLNRVLTFLWTLQFNLTATTQFASQESSHGPTQFFLLHPLLITGFLAWHLQRFYSKLTLGEVILTLSYIFLETSFRELPCKQIILITLEQSLLSDEAPWFPQPT